jgi:hypothetical protein
MLGYGLSLSDHASSSSSNKIVVPYAIGPKIYYVLRTKELVIEELIIVLLEHEPSEMHHRTTIFEGPGREIAALLIMPGGDLQTPFRSAWNANPSSCTARPKS